MSCGRRSDRGCGGGVREEEMALCAVLSNAVEVDVGREGVVGIAVYGPRFSWFNHSCAPNACFRFELLPQSGPALDSGDMALPKVIPAGANEAASGAAWESWIAAESQLNHGLSSCGPRVVVRSIKPIKKGEEVCITYTDLLQPKAMRHSDLWSKYHFVCCCERCCASPQIYIDYILSCNAWNMNSDHNSVEMNCEEQAQYLDQIITSYMSNGNAKACCEKLEKLLSGSFQDESHEEESSQRKSKLHPLQYLSLNAYITLASTYRFQACEENIPEDFKMSRAAAAYSLLLSGVVHHLFLSEPSLIASVCLYTISAGESILDLVRSPMWGRTKINCSRHPVRESFVSEDELNATSMRFVEYLSCILLKSWPFLVQGFPYLESIKSPVNFSWLGITNTTPQILNGVTCSDFGGEEEIWGLIQLAIHCLSYGKYIANICYGPRCYLVEHAEDLLHGIRTCRILQASKELTISLQSISALKAFHGVSDCFVVEEVWPAGSSQLSPILSLGDVVPCHSTRLRFQDLRHSKRAQRKYMKIRDFVL